MPWQTLNVVESSIEFRPANSLQKFISSSWYVLLSPFMFSRVMMLFTYHWTVTDCFLLLLEETYLTGDSHMAFAIVHLHKKISIECTENYDTCDDLGINSINKTTLVHHCILKLVIYKSYYWICSLHSDMKKWFR